MTAPKFLAPDGVLREEYIFTTTMQNRFFSGEISPDTADMQVSIRGGGFVSDPDLIVFEGSSFTIPNPSVFPDGLQLFPGSNRIEVKSILTDGSPTTTSFTNANLSQDSDLGVLVEAPSGISIERFNGVVTISLQGIDDDDIIAYNFYASVSPGGGTEGYSRLNVSRVIAGTSSEEVSTLAELNVDAATATSLDGTPASDPLLLAVSGQQIDRSGQIFQTDFNEALQIPDTVSNVRTNITVSSVRQIETFSFTHDRQATFNSANNPAIPNSSFTSIPIDQPIYYVATAIYLSGTTEIESQFSTEVAGSPLSVTPNLGRFPQVSRQEILREATLSIFRSQPQISTVPGSTLRDTFLDPFSTEAERIRFLLDFLHNAQSLSTLLRIDDPELSGQSIPVAQSAYKIALKQALFIRNVGEVQTLIDRMFEQRASNFGLTRNPGNRARGEVTFFTTRRPTTTITIPIGQTVSGGGVNFLTTSSAQITSEGAGAFFDPQTGRFSVNVFIQAQDAGVSGNVAARQINQVNNGPSGLQVTNLSQTFGGTDQESNRDLAERAIRVLSSADSGRLQGYVDTASNVPGVLQVNVVDAGHPLMKRDIDPLTGEHLLGKVDVWVRGSSPARIVDTFAFEFEIAQDIQFEPVGLLSDLRFRAIDSRLSSSNPIIEMLDRSEFGFGLRNASQGTYFDLTNVQIIGFNQIQLDASLNDPIEHTLTDLIQGDFRFRTSEDYIFDRQPVNAIESLVGTVTGTVSPTSYALFQASSPLDLGRSTEAGDFLRVTETDGGVTIPSGDPVVVTDEAHVLLDGVEFVNNLGANPVSLRVLSPDRSIEFRGPFDPSGSSDYSLITPTDNRTPLGILVTEGSQLASGDSVVFDYEHDENFTVTYETNAITSAVQSDLDVFRHITADVLAKEAIEVPVDIFGTVVVLPGASVPLVRSRIRTNLTNLFNTLALGEPIRVSDVITALDSTEDVSYVVNPLALMTRGDDSTVVREGLLTAQASDLFYVEDWSTATVDTYLIRDSLDFATTDGGGPENNFRGVFINDAVQALTSQPPNVAGLPLKNAPNQSFIIGNSGLLIPGYSDNTTLLGESPFASEEQLEDQRVAITANRLVVTLPKNETIVGQTVEVTYTVAGASGVVNVDPGPVSYLVLGDIDFTIDEDTNLRTSTLR